MSTLRNNMWWMQVMIGKLIKDKCLMVNVMDCVQELPDMMVTFKMFNRKIVGLMVCLLVTLTHISMLSGTKMDKMTVIGMN